MVYFGSDLAILNHDQITRTTPELKPPIQTSTSLQREGVCPLRMIYCATGPIHGGSSVETGLELGTLRPQKSRPYHKATAACNTIRKPRLKTPC
ncbi:hypothetical protein AVEN_147073-1 [Araneus ventricosus]|uniref:Uncharacterized protein n=1 Tax=Araneus ventricosus TaxID=182803 RepID=A0A4Y2E5T4_ARAVE|nr:hypothetical protein AVEN_147073-1 [Araneus ventricosus]